MCTIFYNLKNVVETTKKSIIRIVCSAPSRRSLLISYCCPSHKWSQVRGVQISQFATDADHFCNATWSWAGGRGGGIPMIVLKEGGITLFLYFCRSICSTKIASNFRVLRIITSTKWTVGRG